MTPQTVVRLNELNRQFYEVVAESFSATRQQPWQGWENMWEIVAPLFPKKEKLHVFDIGCGNGRFADFFGQKLTTFPDVKFEYTGIDQSEKLTTELKEKPLAPRLSSGTYMQFDVIKMLQEKGQLLYKPEEFDLLVSFGVVHHLPSFALRKLFFEKIAEYLEPGGIFVVSLWQFDKNEKLMTRRVEPEKVGFDSAELEKNDYLLTWERGQHAVRYCHVVDDDEQQELIAASGLKVIGEFQADGKSGEDNQYVLLQK